MVQTRRSSRSTRSVQEENVIDGDDVQLKKKDFEPEKASVPADADDVTDSDLDEYKPQTGPRRYVDAFFISMTILVVFRLPIRMTINIALLQPVIFALRFVLRVIAKKIALVPSMQKRFGGNETLQRKWIEQMLQLFFHAGLAVFGAIIVFSEGWYSRPYEIWLSHPALREVKTSVYVLYCFELAFYIWCGVEHTFLAKPRRDFYMMSIHHTVTVTLIGASWVSHFTPVGVLVTTLHDISDIPVDLVKSSNYLRSEFGTMICFILLLITWPWIRLWIFPRVVISNCIWMSFVSHKYYSFFFTGFLIVLYVFHWYWYKMFLNILYGVLNGKDTAQASATAYEAKDEDSSTLDETKRS